MTFRPGLRIVQLALKQGACRAPATTSGSTCRTAPLCQETFLLCGAPHDRKVTAGWMGREGLRRPLLQGLYRPPQRPQPSRRHPRRSDGPL